MRHAFLLIASIITATACSDGPLSPEVDEVTTAENGIEAEDVRPIRVVGRYHTGMFGEVYEYIAWTSADSATVWERDVRRITNNDGTLAVERWLIARGDDGYWWVHPEDNLMPIEWYRVGFSVILGVRTEDVDSPEVANAIAANGDEISWRFELRGGMTTLSVGIGSGTEPPEWSDPVIEKLDYYLGLPELFTVVRLQYSAIVFG